MSNRSLRAASGTGGRGPLRTSLWVLLMAFGFTAVVTSCGGGDSGSQAATPAPPVTPPATPVTSPPAAPAGASKAVTLQVPAGMNSAPFDRPRTLNVPPGFDIHVFARVPNARFLALAPNGDLLVSDPSGGRITLLRPNGDAAPGRYTFASGLNTPHDIAFQVIGATTYVYLSESNRVIRAPYVSGDTSIGAIEVLIAGLPDASTPALGGAYSHPLKNFALHGNKIYVSIGSSCNACAGDTSADPIRGAIYEYDLDGGNRRLYARGIRNAEGLAFRPGSDELWAVVNNRDNIAYPFHQDINGDGADDYGRVVQSYVDGHPPDLLIKVKDGGQYGWPFCNSNPDQGLDNMPFDRDVELNPDGSQLACDSIDRVTKGLPPHSAPLGMSFLQDSGLPAAYRNALVTGLHGCWNCSAFNGHEIALYPVDASGTVGDRVDLVTGWLVNAAGKDRWGRPVDVIPDGKQGLYISDDLSGTVYQLTSGG